MNSCRLTILLLFFCLLFGVSYSIPIKNDTSDITLRTPSAEKISALKKDNDLNYRISPLSADSFWDKIKYAINRFLDIIFSDHGPAVIIRWLIMIAFLIFVILKIIKIKPQALFFRNRKTASLTADEFIEDINKVDMDGLIAKETSCGNYRGAIRYMYLKLLKTLSENNIIEWTNHKTNSDYRVEITGTNHEKSFISLSVLYEFIWYGDFSVDSSLFEKINTEFNEFFRSINSRS
ncbi:MAG: hypothetical protein HY958_11005 [Bacteroidia bacterium]|nr:hypothetical protein [Bacteroidia bacterium]